MSDYYLISDTKCKKCNKDLIDLENDFPLYIDDEHPIILTCPKCKARTRFWMETKIKSELINHK